MLMTFVSASYSAFFPIHIISFKEHFQVAYLHIHKRSMMAQKKVGKPHKLHQEEELL